MSRVLCTTHNNALGPFDAFANVFDDELRRITAASTVSTHILFNGNNLERWMLKTLCALVASGSARKTDATKLFSDIPEFWVDVLLEAAILPHRWVSTSAAGSASSGTFLSAASEWLPSVSAIESSASRFKCSGCSAR